MTEPTDSGTPQTSLSFWQQILGFVASSLPNSVTNWALVGASRQLAVAFNKVLVQASFQQARIVRGMASLFTTFDPGDIDPGDPTNQTLPAGPGFASNMGAGMFGTPRGQATFAPGFVVLTSASGSPTRNYKAGSLVCTWTLDTPPSPAPTYTNPFDPTIYTNGDGSFTLVGGASITIPIIATASGSASTAPSGGLTLTTQINGLSATNPAPVIGSDYELLSDYQARCTEAMSSISPFGPADMYRYWCTSAQRDAAGNIFVVLPGSTTGIGVTPAGSPGYQAITLPNAVGVPVNVTRIQIPPSDGTGIVAIYATNNSGGGGTLTADAADLQGLLDGQASTADCFSMTVTAATGVSVDVSNGGAFKIKVSKTAGVLASNIAVGANAALASLAAGFPSFPIGGYEQDSGGNGELRGELLEAIITQSAGRPGVIIGVVSSIPDTTLATGHVAFQGYSFTAADVVFA